MARLNGLIGRKCGGLPVGPGGVCRAGGFRDPLDSSRGGLFVWMTVPEGLGHRAFDGPLFPRCVREGVIYVPGEFAFAAEPSPRPKNHIRLTFGVPGEPN